MARRRRAGAQPRFFLDPATGRPVEAPSWRQQRRADLQAARATGGRKLKRQVKKAYRRAKRGRLPAGVSPDTMGGEEPQAITDPTTGAPTINVFLPPGEAPPTQYPTGSVGGPPATALPMITDRTKLDLANQVGNL